MGLANGLSSLFIFSEDTGSTYKIQLYFCTLAMNNPKVKFKKTIPFTIASEMIKYLEINRSTKLIL